jgi:hypothetical protein
MPADESLTELAGRVSRSVCAWFQKAGWARCCSAVRFRRSRHGRRAAACARIAATFAGSDPVRVPPGVVARRRGGTVAGRVGLQPVQLLTGCRGVEIHGHRALKYRRSGWGTSTIERAGVRGVPGNGHPDRDHRSRRVFTRIHRLFARS